MENWTAVKQEGGTWLFSWDGESGKTYELWLDGELLDTVEDVGEYESTEADYDAAPPHLEIIEDTEDAENELYSPLVTFQWREVADAVGYIVEEYLGGSWVSQIEIAERSSGYYSYTSDALGDNSTHYFRVRGADVNGNYGTAVNFTFVIVRNPAPPEVTFDIDSSGDLVVEEA